MTAVRAFFPKLGHLLQILNKGREEPPPSPTPFPFSSYVSLFDKKLYFGFSQNISLESLNML